ncbi:MAG: hypothetical protein ACE37B_20740 [Ilumatobacter sp.]|uniref:hypothetical protein n=1 Tax=Ilumatobacter sp. TaxID=1967498 RepID=UPI003919E13D
MSLDELNDDQLDRRLRELLPPSPRSRSWERVQRDRLIHFITTGHVNLPNDAPTSADEPGASGLLLELTTPRQDRAPSRIWLFAGAAAAVTILVVGLLAVQRPADAPAPAQQPATTTPATTATPSQVPALPASALAPDQFGVVSDSWPTAPTASAMWGGQLGWDNATAAEALVARRDGDLLRDGIALSVRSDASSDQLRGTPQQATVAGVPVEIYVENGSPAITTVVLPGTPTVTVSGLDPISFLEAAGEFPVYGQRVDDDGEVTFGIGQLPDGYEVIAPPERLPLGSLNAFTRARDGVGVDGDGITVWVEVRNPLIVYAQAGDLQQVDINGTGGWLYDQGPASNVMWQASDTTWANVGGASSADVAMEFARSIEFVDEATWTERYDVAQPAFPTRDEALSAPVSTLPEPTTLIVSRTEVASAPTDKPVACGDTPPSDETLAGSPTASSPDDALAAFLNTDTASTLFKLGYDELTITASGAHRYERYNDTGNLVTVIEVSATADGWRATRVEASPC